MDLPVPVSADFTDLFKAQYGRLVRALTLAGAGSRAEDIAQEAFARALPRWRRIRNGPNPAGYVFLTAFRILRRQGLLPPSALDDQVPASTDVAETAALRVDIDRAMVGMPPRRRACVVLVWFAGSTPSEAAEALGIAPATVRKQLALAKEHMAGTVTR